MMEDENPYKWRPWFAWRPVTANTDRMKPRNTSVWWEWVYRAKRFGFDGAGMMSTYTYLTPDEYKEGAWDHMRYDEATEFVPSAQSAAHGESKEE